MKKLLGKIRLILTLVLLTTFLTGCGYGATIETKLTINDDLSGSRQMELVIDQSVFSEYFTGTIEELNTAITETCPSQLTWVYDESTGAKVYRFTLNFTSPEDYKAKVDTIIGEGSDVQIEMTKADSVWASGVYVDESFTSSDLLTWLKTMLVEKGFVSSSNSGRIFQTGSTNVLFGENEYSASSRIDIDEIEYLKINSIISYTEVSAFDNYGKTIKVSIPESSMEAKGEEIKTWLAAHVPSGATSEWVTEDTNSIFVVSGSKMTGEQLQAFLNTFFESETCTVAHREIKDNMSPFSFNVELIETIDYRSFILGDRMYYTDTQNYVKGVAGYVGGRYLSDLYGYEPDESENDGYTYANSDYSYDQDNTKVYTSYYQKVYKVSDVNIESKIGPLGGLSRKFVFTLGSEPSDAEKEAIVANIEELGVKYAEQKMAAESTENVEPSTEEPSTEGTEKEDSKKDEFDWKVKIEDKTKDGAYTVTITQSGNRDEIKESSTALFGSSGDFYKVKDFGFAKLNYGTAVYDSFQLGDFVRYRTEHATATYVLDTGLGSKVEYANRDTAALDGAKVTLKDDAAINGVSVMAYCSQFNFWALFFFVLFIGGAVCIVLVLKKEGILDQLLAMIPKSAPAATTPAQAPVVETPVVEAPVEEVPMFCENCGAKRDADACVCTQCGTRFEN